MSKKKNVLPIQHEQYQVRFDHKEGNLWKRHKIINLCGETKDDHDLIKIKANKVLKEQFGVNNYTITQITYC